MNVGDKLYDVRLDMDTEHDGPTIVEYEIAKLTPVYVWLKRTAIGGRPTKHQVMGPRHEREWVVGRYSLTVRGAIERAAASYERQISEAENKFIAAKARFGWCIQRLEKYRVTK